MVRYCVILIAIFLSVVSLSASASAQTEVPTLHIPKVKQAPKLDDFINGTPREAEATVTDFRQWAPKDGNPPTQQTIAYISYDDRNLYVAFVCKDEPDKIRARMAKRDTIGTDDRVTVNIDTFHDHHRAYFFDVNPLGVQFDGVTSELGDDLSFDTLWYSDGRLTKDGYAVLITVPFKSLRFPKKPMQDWGIVLARTIQRNNEWDCWPYLTQRVNGWVPQFAHIDGVENISPGRNIQLIPYGMFSRARTLDTTSPAAPRFSTDNDLRLGLDAKMVLNDSFSLDLTLNPDFSQVESDEPQVTVNQRYEVFFPEKRPFFMENAGMFQTPENLFFSRRVADPQIGARLTGNAGRWGIGIVGMDDRAPGRRVSEMDPEHGQRAGIGVFRLKREFGQQSHVGTLVTTWNFGAASNQVYSFDTRLQLNPNWTVNAQAVRSQWKGLDRETSDGNAIHASIGHYGKHLSYDSNYTDRSPGFRSELGYIPRVDIRELAHNISYYWKPDRGSVVSFGPSLSVSTNWDRKDRMQDWMVSGRFSVDLPGLTNMQIHRTEYYELYRDIGFRKGHTGTSFNTEWFKWLATSVSFEKGSDLNYYPAGTFSPFLGDSTEGSLGFTVRPNPNMKIEETYLYTRLGTREGKLPAGASPGSIFNNHIIRSKLNYQLNRELSLRAILDYNSVLANDSLITFDRDKRLTADFLFTYMMNPGTALYVGYTDLYQNLDIEPVTPARLRRTLSPSTSVGRQFFIKMSYLFRM